MANKRILIVDDNPMFLTLAARTLVAADYLVKTLDPGSVFDVLKACISFKPDLAIIDYHLPRCNPETLVLILKEDPSFQPLALLGISTSRDQHISARMLSAGVDRFEPKGSMASLTEAVRTLLL
jgi:CheY-like chemotaxis protein